MSDETQESLKIKFDGQLNQVDVNTLTSSLINFSAAIQEINTELNPDQKVNIKIQATEKGSFLIDVLIVVAVAQDLFKHVIYAPILISTFADVLTIKKHLSGEEPKKIEEIDDQIKIENVKGDVIIVKGDIYNIYNNNQVVQDAVSNTFDTLRNDPSISSFEIETEKKKIFSAGLNDFNNLAIKSEVKKENKKVITQTVTLIIFKIVFENKYKWEFYYGGNKISAYIADKSFFERIDSGEKFSKGDNLTVELEIRQIFDKSVNAYVNHSYQVNKVMKHIPRGEEPKLDIS